MYRRLPILLIILTTATGARAEQGFFDQFFGSSSTSGPFTSQPAGDSAAAAVSEPLALQPTATRPPHSKKRSHTSRRHHQAAPEHQDQARSEPRAVEKENGDRDKSEAKPVPPVRLVPPVPPEAVDRSAPAADTVPPVDPAPSVAGWSDPSPPAPAQWPVESPAVNGASPAANAQIAEPENVQDQTPLQAVETEEAAARSAEDAEPQSFIDRERSVLASFSAAWLALGIMMFILRRPIARVIVAWRRRRMPIASPRIPPRFTSPPQLTLILENADRTTEKEQAPGERRVLSVG